MRDTRTATAGSKRTYLDFELFVNLHDLPEDGNVLHETCKLPTVPDALEQTRFFWGLLLGGSDRIGAAALSRYHLRRNEAVKAGVVNEESAGGDDNWLKVSQSHCEYAKSMNKIGIKFQW